MASGLSRRVSEIEHAIALLRYIHDRLRYLQPTITGLIGSACDAGELGEIPYLEACRKHMSRGVPFPQSWRDALTGSSGALGKEETALMSALGEVLGSTDLDTQLNTLDYTRGQMELRLDGARSYRDTHTKLYSSLGVLGGIAIVVILI